METSKMTKAELIDYYELNTVPLAKLEKVQAQLELKRSAIEEIKKENENLKAKSKALSESLKQIESVKEQLIIQNKEQIDKVVAAYQNELNYVKNITKGSFLLKSISIVLWTVIFASSFIQI